MLKNRLLEAIKLATTSQHESQQLRLQLADSQRIQEVCILLWSHCLAVGHCDQCTKILRRS